MSTRRSFCLAQGVLSVRRVQRPALSEQRAEQPAATELNWSPRNSLLVCTKLSISGPDALFSRASVRAAGIRLPNRLARRDSIAAVHRFEIAVLASNGLISAVPANFVWSRGLRPV